MNLMTLRQRHHCGISGDQWQAIRIALRLTQGRLATALALTERSIRRIESVDHVCPQRCPSRQTVQRLEWILDLPSNQLLLELAGIPNPFKGPAVSDGTIERIARSLLPGFRSTLPALPSLAVPS